MAHLSRIKIAARLRPRINGEIDDDSVKVIHSAGSSATHGSFVSVVNPRDTTQIFKFPFTSCYDQSAPQDHIFNNDVKPMIDVVFQGVTVTIFAYGVTSSGKTHTMQGTREEPGIIPRTLQSMFSRASLSARHAQLSMSYMEIYKDEVYDLLVDRDNAPKLPVRENEQGKVFVANLTTESITDFTEFDAIYARATKRRSVGATNLNRASSRSHAILSIHVLVPDSAHGKTLIGKINLVDLAGSENNKLTGNDPSRMAESAAINKSLSVLGQVVHALNLNQPRIPYRNSKLTRILQDALGGSSVGLLVCNLAPGVKFRQDTLNTLNFAVRTKNIENKPVVNEQDDRPALRPYKLAAKVAPPAVAGPSRPRPSMVPVPRAPRTSALGSLAGFQPFIAPPIEPKIEEQERLGGLRAGLTEDEIDARIAKAVEREVARRLEERERQREKEERERLSHQQDNQRTRSKSPKKEDISLPSGVLTPMLKRHKDLDDEVRARLETIEDKLHVIFLTVFNASAANLTGIIPGIANPASTSQPTCVHQYPRKNSGEHTLLLRGRTLKRETFKPLSTFIAKQRLTFPTTSS
ncbi:hypothetical protein HGRIS_011233 [Hohenbuehelia grisea]|uniref:Kinesin-like protein n=1 Tax=Hohenbuehelia grisea TaxID=104357 RepID=A0ABR3JUI6_9AGAR